jgi:hypothetical protein
MEGTFDILSFQVRIYCIHAYIRVFFPVAPVFPLVFPYLFKSLQRQNVGQTQFIKFMK